MSIKALLVALGTVIVALVMGCGTAQADVYGSRGDSSATDYTRELWDVGLTVSASEGEALALDVCSSIEQLGSERAMTRWVADRTGWSPRRVVVTVLGATFHYCPWFEESYGGN